MTRGRNRRRIWQERTVKLAEPSRQKVTRARSARTETAAAQAHPLGAYAELGNRAVQRILRSGDKQGAFIARRALSPEERGVPVVHEETPLPLAQRWRLAVLDPIAEATSLIKSDAPSQQDLVSACARLSEAADRIQHFVDQPKLDVDLRMKAWRLFLQVKMLARAIQPYIGASTAYKQLVTEADLARSTAEELQDMVSPDEPSWGPEVVNPIGEAANTLSADGATRADLAEARARLYTAARKVRALAAEGDLDVAVSMRLWRYYMQVTMLERGLHPYTGARTEMSRVQDEADYALEVASELTSELP